MQPDQARRHPLDKVEAGIPHQRAIAEDPEILRVRPIRQFLHRLSSPRGSALAARRRPRRRIRRKMRSICVKAWNGAAKAPKTLYRNNLVFETPHSAGEEKACQASPPSA